MKTLAVIPTRYASTRLPGKALKDETGWPLIRHVYEQVIKSEADRVIVATDDQRIVDAVRQFGGEVLMTKSSHQGGADRVAEVASRIKGFDIILNIQGDEPEIQPEAINKLIQLQKEHNPFMTTLYSKFPKDKKIGHGSPLDPAAVKIVLGKRISSQPKAHQVIFFSRHPIPYAQKTQGIIEYPEDYYMHIGIYAYSLDAIKEFATLPKGFLEITESIDQLRIIENGYNIIAGEIDQSFPGIDTLEDYQAFVVRWNYNSGMSPN